MAWQDFFEGAMRGTAASLRGYMQAKVNIAKAKNERELQRAQIEFNKERNNLLRNAQRIDLEKAKMENAMKGREVESKERLGMAGYASTENVARTQADANVAVADINKEGVVESSRQQAMSNVSIAQIEADSKKALGQVSIDIAQLQADANTELERIRQEGLLAIQKATSLGELRAIEEQMKADIEKARAAGVLDIETQKKLLEIQQEMKNAMLLRNFQAYGGVLPGTGAAPGAEAPGAEVPGAGVAPGTEAPGTGAVPGVTAPVPGAMPGAEMPGAGAAPGAGTLPEASAAVPAPGGVEPLPSQGGMPPSRDELVQREQAHLMRDNDEATARQRWALIQARLSVRSPEDQDAAFEEFRKVQQAVRTDPNFKAIQIISFQQSAIKTAYEDASRTNSGFSDLAIINSFQRMIDPGVSVREGDVELMRGFAMSWLGQTELAVSRMGLDELVSMIQGEAEKRASTGAPVLTQTARDQIMNIANRLSENARQYAVRHHSAPLQSLLATSRQLRGLGLTLTDVTGISLGPIQGVPTVEMPKPIKAGDKTGVPQDSKPGSGVDSSALSSDTAEQPILPSEKQIKIWERELLGALQFNLPEMEAINEVDRLLGILKERFLMRGATTRTGDVTWSRLTEEQADKIIQAMRQRVLEVLRRRRGAVRDMPQVPSVGPKEGANAGQ